MRIMGTSETRLARGRRNSDRVVRKLIGQLVERRVDGAVSQRTLARELGVSQAEVWRREHLVRPSSISFADISEMASVLGLELGAGLYPAGDPIRDRGHVALGRRFRILLASRIRAQSEVLLPNPNDLRAWDLLLHIGPQVVGVELETRIRDVQALARRLRERERDGGAAQILLVLADTATNRRLVSELSDVLGPRWATGRRVLMAALRKGEPLPGSGIILV
jgi:transcriptional regulator with XRE-family HTH domain